jgi:hypothetical protein
MPTILELAGIPLPPQVQGRSLLYLMTGGDHETLPAYFETYRPDVLEKGEGGIEGKAMEITPELTDTLWALGYVQ